ncbi:hypothetical protein [Geobacillus subterraneus]|uniref:Uncharacterized protein n=1 Tax=Geobacillus subterraneus TaxID=129338 RepID=A0A679FXW5_9BACL|nr:hypothetical protein [Geobacillus subterraneus]BBW98947.1 hypothetical protein GsuE55_37800 [Geobacillus subterraneus]
MQQWMIQKYIEIKHRAYVIKHVEHVCENCGEKGLVVMRISNLTLLACFFLGAITSATTRLFLHQPLYQSLFLGMIVWFGTTWVNILRIKPQCRYCFSERVRIPDEEEMAANDKKEDSVLS